MHMAANLGTTVRYVRNKEAYLLSRLVGSSPDSNYGHFAEVLIVGGWRRLVAVYVSKTEPNVRAALSIHENVILDHRVKMGGIEDR